jgi:diaminopimelate decarboxylase
MVHQGKDYLIRKRQPIQDILHNQEIITLPEVKKNKKEAVPA